MIKMLKNSRRETCTEQRTIKIIVLCMVLLIAIPLISADLYFDNVKGDLVIDETTSEYGKIEIRDWFGLQKLKEVELISNTEACYDVGCSANKTITMYQDGKLIDDIRFVALDSLYNKREDIVDYSFHYKVNNVWIEYQGEEVKGSGEGIVYEFEIKGELYPYQRVDWIIQTSGEWIDEWAVWTSSLNVNLTHYYNMSDHRMSNNLSEGMFNLSNHTQTGGEQWIDEAYNDFVPGGLIGLAANATTIANPFVNFTHYVTKEDITNFSTGNKTINIWFKPETVHDDDIIMKSISGANWGLFEDDPGGGYRNFNIGALGDQLNASLGAFKENEWSMFTLVLESSGNLSLYNNSIIYQNSTQSFIQSAGLLDFGDSGGVPTPFEGLIDEIGMWDRALTQEEVNQLYNDGAGITFSEGESDLEITLNSPVNGFATTSDTISFNASLIPIALNLTNATLFVWDSSSTIFNQTTISITGDEQNDSLFSVSDFAVGNFEWNVLGCGTNATSTLCELATSNFTFQIRQFEILNQTFNLNASETESQDFTLSINITGNILSVASTLNYNGTSYPGQTECTGSLCVANRTIDIPLNDQESQNNTGFWEVTIFDGTSSSTFNTTDTPIAQNVSRIHLETCGAIFNAVALNFTAFDEQNLTEIKPFEFAGDFRTWLGSGTVKRESNFTNSSANEVSLCVAPNRTYFTDAIVEYDEVGNTTIYTARNYFFQNDQIDNNSQSIPLYLLKSEFATSFILKVQDANILPLPNHLIFTQRFYPGLAEFRTVQVSRTADNGQTVGFFETETADYRFIIKLNATTLLQTSSQKVVGESVPFTLTFTIGEDLGKPWAVFENITGITFSLIFNKNTNFVTYTYQDISTNFSLGTLIVEKQEYSLSTNPVICNSNSSLSAATLTCNLTGNDTGTYIAKGFVERGSEEFLVNLLNFVIETFSDIAGLLGVLLGWFIILISAFAFQFNEIAGIVMVNAAIILVNLIGLVSFGPVFITAIIAASIIIIVVMER